MLHAVLPFVLFPPRHNKVTFALSALAGVDMVVVTTLGDRIGHLGPAIPPEALRVIRPILLGGLFVTLAACGYYIRRATQLAEAALDVAHQRSEDVPQHPARVDRGLAQGARRHHRGQLRTRDRPLRGHRGVHDALGAPDARPRRRPPTLFCHYDDSAGLLGLEKIKTIGDCYMVAGGLPVPRADHAEAVAEMALAMQRVTREFRERWGEAIHVRVGIHSGPVVAGVIGKRKLMNDLRGDTVNTASGMASHGVADTVHITDASYELLEGKFRMTARGVVEIKGKGPMKTWFLEAREEPSPVVG